MTAGKFICSNGKIKSDSGICCNASYDFGCRAEGCLENAEAFSESNVGRIRDATRFFRDSMGFSWHGDHVASDRFAGAVQVLRV